MTGPVALQSNYVRPKKVHSFRRNVCANSYREKPRRRVTAETKPTPDGVLNLLLWLEPNRDQRLLVGQRLINPALSLGNRIYFGLCRRLRAVARQDRKVWCFRGGKYDPDIISALRADGVSAISI